MCRSDSSLLRLVKDYPRTASAVERCAFIGQELGLEGSFDPDRLFAVGQYMPCKRCHSSPGPCQRARMQASHQLYMVV